MPTIAYHYRDIWGRDITVDENYVKDGYVQRRTFKPQYLDEIEYYMQMMIVGSNKIGQLHLSDGKLSVCASTSCLC